ncbi:Phosphoenolpyruvate synthase [hydrothermal vent metagenome]|uniref:pyruvate, water dikinase n=1 Tax=hydrothermal vent metagenome TaxID=652676 RepID=A0A3B0UVL6_9ZZZZ
MAPSSSPHPLQKIFRRLRSLWRSATGGRAVELPVLFARFQAVLAAKNRALEIITDMGEKLGGDYLFDINYTQSAYASLFEAMEESISAFAKLTDNRYPELAEVLARIDGLIRRMLTSTGPGSNKLVLFHGDITWDLAGEVGGKNYQLAVLHNELKLRVPPAFAISTAAFDEYLQHNGLTGQLADMGDEAAGGEAALAAMRRAVLAGSLPPDFAKALAAAVRKMRSRCGRHCRLAVRSSADEEDGFFSFAGQFESILNVECTESAVAAAYRQVVASLFQPDAVAYQRHLGYGLGRVKMAVACVAMIEAEVSGVVYTAAAANDQDTLLISAAWGLGPGVVDGLTDADLYTVRKGENPELINVRVGRKELMVVRSEGGEGTTTVATPEELRSKSCLSESQVLELARQAMTIEAFYKSPQDIEWALDGQGRCYFLQTRGLRLGEVEDSAPAAAPLPPEDLPVLMRNRGTVVQHGATAGRVFILQHVDDLDRVPRGSILVARHDSPHFVRVIPFVNAIITDLGTPTSHMASICREFAIPTVVNTGDATTVLTAGQEVTLVADSGGDCTVLQGVAHELLRRQRRGAANMREVYEYRRQKYIMRYIAPLNLVNPLEEEFTARRCRTFNDMIRFMHEMSVQALVEGAVRQGNGLLKLFGRQRAVRRLKIDLPLKMLLVDLGGGVAKEAGAEVTFDELTSVPLRAVLQGMMHPGVWHEEGVALRGRDLMASMTRAADLSNAGATAGYNVAVVSREYVNLSLRFGYHFSMLDCYCGDRPRNNHIFFRFVGGAASITSRSLRLRLMATVLAEYDYVLKITGDLLVARLSNIGPDEICRILDQTGRLSVYVKQLDAQLDSEESADRLAREFLRGNYTIQP